LALDGRLALGALALLLGAGELVVDPLEESHLGAVARPRPELQDAQVAAVAFLEARRHLVEQLLDQRPLGDPAAHLAAGVDGAALALGDDLLGDRPQLLGLGERGADAAALHQRGELVTEERLAVLAGAAELAALDVVTHWSDSLSTTAKLDRGAALADVHPELETEAAEGLLQLLERLAAEA